MRLTMLLSVAPIATEKSKSLGIRRTLVTKRIALTVAIPSCSATSANIEVRVPITGHTATIAIGVKAHV